MIHLSTITTVSLIFSIAGNVLITTSLIFHRDKTVDPAEARLIESLLDTIVPDEQIDETTQFLIRKDDEIRQIKDGDISGSSIAKTQIRKYLSLRIRELVVLGHRGFFENRKFSEPITEVITELLEGANYHYLK